MTVETAGISISAVIRIGIHCGIEVVQDDSPLKTLDLVKVRAGMELAVFVHLAEFVTNVMYAPNDKECKLKVIQEYNLALGAVAGASVAMDLPKRWPQTWGPVIETSIAVFTTELAQVCVHSAKTSVSQASIAGLKSKRQNLATTTISTIVTTSGVICSLPGVKNCPASQQNTQMTTITQYLTTPVPPGVTPTFPATISNGIQRHRDFGPSVKSIKAMSGSPSGYTAPSPSPSATDSTHFHGAGAPLAHSCVKGAKKQVAIGVGIGLGIPLLAAIVGAML